MSPLPASDFSKESIRREMLDVPETFVSFNWRHILKPKMHLVLKSARKTHFNVSTTPVIPSISSCDCLKGQFIHIIKKTNMYSSLLSGGE